jgi:tetratricopeptide (TPR) repeat protein
MALEAARLWSELDPEASRPKQLVAALAAGGTGKALEVPGDRDELRTQIERVLADAAASGSGLGDTFLQLNTLLAQDPDRAATFRLVQAVAQPYPNSAEAHYAVALAGLNSGLPDIATTAIARSAVERALTLKPGWERAVLLKAEILARSSPSEAVAYLEAYVQAEPGAKAAAAGLAQLYVEQKRYAEARAVFQRLVDGDKDNQELRFGIAVLSAQMKEWPQAEAQFQALKRAGYGADDGAVDIYLAQIAEETGRTDVAIERYRAVPDGDRGWMAKLRIATLMAKQNRVAEARRYLSELPAVTIEQRVQVAQAEAQLLRDAGDNAGAHAVLVKALAEFPDQPDLLYDTAMVAEKLDRLDEAEARLTQLIDLNPQNAQALNALGYTLVDRTPRVAEGAALIEKALKLSPDDPFILDSMGWAYFRMGRLDDAERNLRRAMAARPDAEIAAHLGEVLWAKGERDRAREVWQSQLATSPDNPVLLETMRRLAK